MDRDTNMLNKLPNEIIFYIKDYMWGHKSDYQKKLKMILENLPEPEMVQINLTAIRKCYYKNKYWEELEDNLFCPRCGEKTLWFPFFLSGKLCEYCQSSY